MNKTGKMKNMTPLKNARKYCLWCCVDQAKEVRECPKTDCVLYPYRLNKGNIRLKTIKLKCFDCSGFNRKEVVNCQFNGIDDEFCYLYPYRLGHRPKKEG